MRWSGSRPIVLGLLPLALLAGCSSAGEEDSEQSESVSKTTMGDSWPLSVDKGTLRCNGSDGVGEVTIEVDGKTYAINGSAKGNEAYEVIDVIWADDTTPGVKKNISPLIQKGLGLCE